MTGRHGVVLIDDETLARRRLRQLLHAAPDFDVVGETADARDAAALVRELRPDVAFLDVRMPHLDGFDVQAAIRSAVRHVVFVTAHAEHAARAFDVAASDYLVKPVTQARFDTALDRIRRTLTDGEERVLLGNRQGGTVTVVRAVRWVEARGAYVTVHAVDRSHVLRASLGQMIARLGERRFARIHRSAIVNVDHVRGLRRGAAGLEVELSNGHRLPVSRRQAREVVSLLEGPKGIRSQPA